MPDAIRAERVVSLERLLAAKAPFHRSAGQLRAIDGFGSFPAPFGRARAAAPIQRESIPDIS